MSLTAWWPELARGRGPLVSLVFSLWLLLAPSTHAALTDTQQSELGTLEEQLLGYQHPELSDVERLSILEELVTGESGSTASDEARLNQIKTSLAVPSTERPADFRIVASSAGSSPNPTATAPTPVPTATSATTAGGPPSYDRRPILSKPPAVEDLADYSRQLFEIINEERRLRRLSTLSRNKLGDQLALEHAAYLVHTGQFSHLGYRGYDPDLRYSILGGSGRVAEIVDGFFATAADEPVALDRELPHQLMDAQLAQTDRQEVLFDPEASGVGVAFVRSPDQRQLVVVIEAVREQGRVKVLPPSLPPKNYQLSGRVGAGYDFAWIGVGQVSPRIVEETELTPKPYFAPLDQVVYVDDTKSRGKQVAQIGGMVLAAVAAPFTQGLSMLAYSVLSQQISLTYQSHEVEVRSGVDADRNGSFSVTLPLGEYGRGIYHVTVWAKPAGGLRNVLSDRSNSSDPAKANQPIVLSRQAVIVE